MSKAFRFSLDVALQHRKRLEQNAQLALFRCIQSRNVMAAEVTRMENVLRAAEHSAAWPGGTVDASSRMNQLIYLDRTAQHVKQLTNQLQQWDEQVRRARAALRETSQRRMALERLRERRRLEYDELQRQIMDRELDELSTMRYARLADQGRDADAPLIS